MNKYLDRIFDLLDKISDGAYVVDYKQQIIFWNKAAEHTLGLKAKDVLSQYCYDVIRGRDELGCIFCKKVCSNFVKGKKDDPIPTRNLLTQKKDGKPVWLNISFFTLPLNNRKHFGIIHIFRDVTQQKQIEQFVEHLHINLDKLSRPDSLKNLTVDNIPINLTKRELQVLKLISTGLSTRTIGEKLHLSPLTVRNHSQNILKKFQVHSRLEAVSMAFKLRLI